MTGRKNRLIIINLLNIICIIIIVYLAFQPFKDQDLRPLMKQVVSKEMLLTILPDIDLPNRKSSDSYSEPYILAHFLLRKGAHLFIYAGLSFLLVYQQLLAGAGAVKAFSRTLLLVILVAATDEGIQHFNENRSGSLADVMLDISGSVFVLFWLKWREKKMEDFPLENNNPLVVE